MIPPGVPGDVSPGQDRGDTQRPKATLLATRRDLVVAVLGEGIPVRETFRIC